MLHAASKHTRAFPHLLFLGALALSPILVTSCGDAAPAKVEPATTNKVGDPMMKAAEKTLDGTKKVGEAVADGAKKTADAAVDVSKKAVEATKETAKKTADAVGGATTKAGDAGKKALEDTKSAAADGMKKAAEMIKPSSEAPKSAAATTTDPVKVPLASATEADKANAVAKAADAQKAAQAAMDEKQKLIKAEADKAASNQVVNERELKARMAELEAQGVSEADARAKAMAEIQAKMASTKPVDPMAQDIDPNSKAKLVYEFGTDMKAFGKVMQGEVLSHKFKMQSDGEEDLVIKQAKPTCGCTVANILVEENGTMVAYQYGKPITPGKKIEIDATLHTVNKRGHASSKININSNDPRGQTILSLEAEVEPFFAINPASLNFNRMSAKDTATDKFTVSTSKGDRIKLTAVKDMLPQGVKVDVNALDADADGKGTRFDVVVTAGPGLVEGNLAYSVRLLSDLAIPGGEKMPNGQMPTYEAQASVMAQVTGAISFTPQFISLGLIRPGQSLARTVRITSHDPAFKITDPKISIQGRDTVEWEFAKYFTPITRAVPGENAVDIEVTLTGMPESLSGSFSGMLVVKTGHPERDEIKALISGVCRGGTTGGTPAPVPTPMPLPGNTPPK
ncbi:MAG: DUF1573 domain-containing protein [Planctomycetota bacterium]|nr:DUF1573 domain-containing protein [Planctomycetota bacterium]